MWNRCRPSVVSPHNFPSLSPFHLWHAQDLGGIVKESTKADILTGRGTWVEEGVDCSSKSIIKERFDHVVQSASGVLHVGSTIDLQ